MGRTSAGSAPQLSLPLRASEVRFASEVCFASEVSPTAKWANFTSLTA